MLPLRSRQHPFTFTQLFALLQLVSLAVGAEVGAEVGDCVGSAFGTAVEAV